jgi:hypothetical protein
MGAQYYCVSRVLGTEAPAFPRRRDRQSHGPRMLVSRPLQQPVILSAAKDRFPWKAILRRFTPQEDNDALRAQDFLSTMASDAKTDHVNLSIGQWSRRDWATRFACRRRGIAAQDV